MDYLINTCRFIISMSCSLISTWEWERVVRILLYRFILFFRHCDRRTIVTSPESRWKNSGRTMSSSRCRTRMQGEFSKLFSQLLNIQNLHYRRLSIFMTIKNYTKCIFYLKKRKTARVRGLTGIAVRLRAKTTASSDYGEIRGRARIVAIVAGASSICIWHTERRCGRSTSL